MDHGLDSGDVAIRFDERGCLGSLRNVRTGWEYLSRPGLDFWQIIYPHDDDPETPIRASDQREVRFSGGDGRLVVRYPYLLDVAGRRLDVALQFEVEAAGEELTFAAEIANASGAAVTELWFPMVGGLGSLGRDADAAFLLYPESAGRRVRNPLANLADRGAQPVRGARLDYLRDFYPGRASMQWMGLYGSAGSLYVGSHDRTLQTTAVSAALNVAGAAADDSLSLGFIKYPFCAPGQRWRGEPFVVAVHAGGWHRDARRYRAFADTYQDHTRRRPRWVRDMPGMHDVVLLHQHGRTNYRYDQIGEVCAAARAGGIDVVKLTGWSAGGHDNRYPDFLPSERLGGEAELMRALARARADGVRVVLYFHFVQMSPNSAFYQAHGEYCALKGRGGYPFIDVFTWPGHGSLRALNERVQLINACVDTDPWQEQVLACVRRGLAWGVDCVFLDQAAGGPGSFLCFDERHGHPSPALAAGPGKTRLAARARQLVKAAGPETALGAEYICDVILQHFDFTIPFGMGFFHGGQHFGEMYRYTFPEDILCTQYVTREDYAQLHYSFVMGYRLFLAPRQQCDLLTDLAPAFVERLASLIGLYRKYASILLRGRFLDTVPLEVKADGLVARAFESPAGAAAAVWNPTDRPREPAIAWPGRRLEGIETPAGMLDASSPILGAGDVAVMVFR